MVIKVDGLSTLIKPSYSHVFKFANPVTTAIAPNMIYSFIYSRSHFLMSSEFSLG